MAFTTDLINTSPQGAVSVFVDGERHEVAHLGTLTVTPEAAGEAPHWRQATDADAVALNANPQALHWRVRAGRIEVFDLGSGLLAQSENWRKDGDTSDPADPLADGHGGTLDPEAQAAELAEALRENGITDPPRPEAGRPNGDTTEENS